ncbi:MAG: hypothetical protein QOD14_786 [Solirubrobacterales bacterium]|jgi:hypothetical protein|nr:hypothetical protein [Solirubrobacterales bacterium]
MAAALVAGAFVCGPSQALASPSVTVAILPSGTTVSELARLPRFSPGVLSAGIGQVPAEQTFLDISQGNRVNGALYEQVLPALPAFANRIPGWSEIASRAAGIPAKIAPGLLVEQLRRAGVYAAAERSLVAPALVAADHRGVVWRVPAANCLRRRCPGLAVVSSSIGELDGLTGRLRGDDLVIALASPPPHDNGTLPIAIAGRGFDGDLTSDSTRTPGYVLSTDIAPTILQRFGLAIPDEMDGEPIRAEGKLDPAAVQDRAERMTAIANRRIDVVVGCLTAWLVAALTVGLVAQRRRRAAAAWLGVTIGFLPLTLLAGAAVEPGAFAEGLMTGIGAGALAAITLLVARGWWAAAVPCAISTVAYAVDVIAGSPLTTLSLLGPNPAFGARFYGIGNELEALIAVMVPVAVGAALTAWSRLGRPASGRVAVAAFLLAGGLAALVFAAGRFGADVGAAVVLPIGAAAAAVAVTWGGDGSRWRVVPALIAAPLAGLALLVLIDLVSGGNAHLTRSVLDAGGAGNLADVAERRLRLSAHDFAQAAGSPLFWVVVAGTAVALAQWRRVDAWLRPAPPARAGVIGACVAVAVGVLVNDSGATFLALGAVGLGATLAFAWSQAPGTDRQ